MYLTKRPHSKSRAGCQGCKRRKIKVQSQLMTCAMLIPTQCDEARPTCSFCSERNLRCIYNCSGIESLVKSSTSSSTSLRTSDFTASPSRHFRIVFQEPQIPAQINVVNKKNATQLRMMHQWLTSTHDSLNVQLPLRCVKNVWQVEVPRLAFEHEFLMHSILAVTCLHLRDLHPDEPNVQHMIAVYQDKAVRGFRTAISEMSQSNYQALLVTSLLFVILGMRQHDMHLEAEFHISQWLSLSIGAQSLFKTVGWEKVEQTPISPIFDFRGNFNLVCVPSILPKGLQEMLYGIETTDPDWMYLETLERTMELLGRLYGCLAQVRSPAPELGPEVWSWAAMLTPTFNELVKGLRPRALVIVAHYLPFLQLFTECWWTRGIAGKEIPAIIKAVSCEWRPLLEIPRLAVELNDKDVAIELLLTQLH